MSQSPGSIPPPPDRPPRSAHATSDDVTPTGQLPVVRPVADGEWSDPDDITATEYPSAEEADDDDDELEGEPPARHRWLVPHFPWIWRRHELASWRLTGEEHATARWCTRLPRPKPWWWLAPWPFKVHRTATKGLGLDVEDGLVYPHYIRTLHFEPLDGDETLHVVRRLHWFSQAKFFVPAIIGGVGGSVLYANVWSEKIASAVNVMLLIWLAVCSITYLVGWFRWVYTLIVVTDRRFVIDTWLPFWLPTDPTSLPLQGITIVRSKQSTLGNMFGFGTLLIGTNDTSEATSLIESGIKMVPDCQSIAVKIDELRLAA